MRRRDQPGPHVVEDLLRQLEVGGREHGAVVAAQVVPQAPEALIVTRTHFGFATRQFGTGPLGLLAVGSGGSSSVHGTLITSADDAARPRPPRGGEQRCDRDPGPTPQTARIEAPLASGAG